MVRANSTETDQTALANAITGAVERHLRSVRDRQIDLQSLFDRKKTALIEGDTGALQRLAAEEDRVAGELTRLENDRHALLASAARSGVKAVSLSELAAILKMTEAVREQIDAVRSDAAALQRQSWTHWIVTSRTSRHYSELITLIATGGEKQESYSVDDQQADQTGGNILDAAA